MSEEKNFGGDEAYWAKLEQMLEQIPFAMIDAEDDEDDGQIYFPEETESGEEMVREAGLVRVGATIEQLLRENVRRTEKAAKDDRCVSREMPRNPRLRTYNPLLWYYRTVCYGKNSDSRGHAQHILILPYYQSRGQRGEQKYSKIVGQDVRDLHIGVRCTCPAFVYWVSEYHSHQDGYALGKTPRGLIVPPKRNLFFRSGESTKKSFLCKHLWTAAQQWKQKTVEPPKKKP